MDRRTGFALAAAVMIISAGVFAFALVEQARSSYGLNGSLAAVTSFEDGVLAYEFMGREGELRLPGPKDPVGAAKKLALLIPAPVRLPLTAWLTAEAALDP